MTVLCPDRVWHADQAPASKARSSVMFLHPPYLRPADVERALFDTVLLDRPRELGLPRCVPRKTPPQKATRRR